MLQARMLAAGLLIAPLCVLFSQGKKTASVGAKHVHVDAIPAHPEDVSSLDAIIKAYYETGSGSAGQPRQWARDRALYIPGVCFIVVMDDEKGKPVVRHFTYQEFVDMADPIEVKNGFYEHEIHRITYRYGSWAHIVSTSEARHTLEGPVTGHGIDNIELFWDGTRWWIASASITVERPNEPLPKEFLP